MASARLLIIGQAPGAKAHASGRPFDDASGVRLRQWLGVSEAAFFDGDRLAVMPMGFCYPGRAKGGDQAPRPECAPLWHDSLMAMMPQVRLTLLIGRHAQERYLGAARRATLADTVRDWEKHATHGLFPLVHPSPRNEPWLRAHPWFEREVVPALQERVRALLP